MPSDTIIEIRVTGVDILPGLVRARELAEILTSVEDMIASVVVAENKLQKKENIIIGLVNVSGGSLRLQFSTPTPDLVKPALYIIAESVEQEEYDKLPSSSIVSLQSLTSFARRHNSDIEIFDLSEQEKLAATITPKTIVVPVPLATGETTIYGTVMRVGGADPKVMIRTIEGITVYCEVEREMAIALGERLYQTVGLYGTAKWNSIDWYLAEFKVESISNYINPPLDYAIKELSEAVQGHFDDIIDVIEYTSRLRGGGQGGE